MKLTETLDLTEHKDGFWLYDKTRGMNLAMRAKTEREALTHALTYYQERLQNVERDHKELKIKVECFINQFNEEG